MQNDIYEMGKYNIMKKRIVSVILALTMCMGTLYGCGEADRGSRDEHKSRNEDTRRHNRRNNDNDDNDDKKDIPSMADYEDSQAILLSGTRSIACAYDLYAEQCTATSFNVYYNGEIERIDHYTLSGQHTHERIKLSDEDYEKVWKFVNALNDGEFKDVNIDACDGDVWSFASYDENDELDGSFSGYIYGNGQLESIEDMLFSYNTEEVSVEHDIPVVTGPQLDIGYKGNVDYMDESYSMVDFSFEFMKYELENGETDNGNIVISPASALYALSMTAMGAEGGTYDSIAGVFNENLNKYDLYSYQNSQIINALGDDVLTISNSFWGNDSVITDKGYTVNEEYLNLLRGNYFAETNMRTFSNDTKDEINSWISEKTGGHIKNMIDEISPDDVCYIINALYFKGTWESKYEENAIDEDGIFINSEGEEETAKMLSSTESEYYETELATGFLKKYEGGNYEFIAILPTDENISIEEFAESFDGEAYRKFLQSCQYEEVSVQMPAFTAEYSAKMDDMLKEMGMEEAYSDNADFSDITDCPDIHVSRVFQSAYIELDETGTEAAAATVVSMEKGVAEESPYYVELDRPYMYVIADAHSDMPLFIGVVNTVE